MSSVTYFLQIRSKWYRIWI